MIQDTLRLALLASGSGTTALAIWEACNTGTLHAEVACLLVSNPEAKAITRLRDAGVPPEHIEVAAPGDFANPLHYGEHMLEIFAKHGVQFVGQYGWMTKTPANVVEAYKNWMVNQHPGALDPDRSGRDFGGVGMYGLRVHCARLLFVQATKHDFWTEATAQRVGREFDGGAVIDTTRKVAILPADTPESLQQRMLPIEWAVQVETIRQFCNGTVTTVKRPVPLVRDDEVDLLQWAKKEARRRYPHG